MKKRLGIIIMSAGLLFTGCSGGVELTTAENNMIAEYIVNVLLKHDRSYDEKLIYETEPVESTEAVAETVATTVATEAPTIVTDPAATQVTEPTVAYNSLNEVFGNKFLDVAYNTRGLYDSYPEKNEKYLLLEAAEGKKLLVVKFRIKNTSAKKQSVYFADEEITYRLEDTAGEVIKPLLTALNNDIQYLHKTIDGNKTKEAVLIFEVDPAINLAEQKLLIQKGESTALVEFR